MALNSVKPSCKLGIEINTQGGLMRGIMLIYFISIFFGEFFELNFFYLGKRLLFNN